MMAAFDRVGILLSRYLQVVILVLFAGGSSLGTQGLKPAARVHHSMAFNRSSFPDDFVFGAGTAAYQSEGAALIDGRGPSIWDTFTRRHPELIWDGSNGDVADDFYHHYKEDVKLMKLIGLDSFRFSLSWTRLLPKGTISGGVNPLGVKFYNNLIDELISNGIRPLVTLMHYDPPQALEDKYGGWLSPAMIKDFREYADFCFKTFGDRVKFWITMNEPNGLAVNGYDIGTFAPNRCSAYNGKCTVGDSATEPYLVAHHLLLAHAAAAQRYKTKYQVSQKGEVGITVVSHWYIPKFKTVASHEASIRALDFLFGWFADPLIHGDYPKIMRSLVGKRLPKFTEAQSKQLKGSLDFLAVNYYTTYYADFEPLSNTVNRSWDGDKQLTQTSYKNATPIGTPTDLDWLFIYPRGIRGLLLYIKEKYNNPKLYITENGLAFSYNASTPMKKALKDPLRIKYHHDHLWYLCKAIKDGVQVKGYYMWSFWDDYEWDAGFTVGFGLTYVDVKNNLKRHLKDSAYWFKSFLLS